MSTLPKTLLTPEQYLDIERQAAYRSEFFKGEMFAMAGASLVHNLLVANIVAALHSQLRSRPCRVLPSDMRMLVSSTGLYTYPDVVVVCNDPQFADERQDTLTNPDLIVEVLSPSTEAYDRGRKFEQYRAVSSLREYLLVASDRVHVDVYARQADGRWLLTSANGPEGTLRLESVDCRLALAELYEKVELEGGQSARS